jgi:hypothetical protein
MVAKASESIHELTSAEIARLSAQFGKERAEIIARRQQIYAEGASGASMAPPLPADKVEATARAVKRLNGWASPRLVAAAVGTQSEDAELRLEQEALDICIDALAQKGLAAAAADGAKWLIEHGAEWRALCREYLLVAERLMALEDKAQAMRSRITGSMVVELPLGAFVGSGGFIDKRPSADPLSRFRMAALAARIVSTKDIEDAHA